MKVSKRTLPLLMILVSASFYSNCTQSKKIGDFTVLSNRNYDQSAKYVKTGNYESEDAMWLILGFPTQSRVPSLDDAIDQCLDAGSGELATNVVMYLKGTSYFFVGKIGYTVRADVWKKATMGDLHNPNIEKYNLVKNQSGKQELVSESNYNEKYAVYDENLPANSQIKLVDN